MDLSIAISPSTPLLVPELGGEVAKETADLREAAITAARSLPTRWIAIGVGAGRYRGEVLGTFAGYGVDVLIAIDRSTALGGLQRRGQRDIHLGHRGLLAESSGICSPVRR